MRNLYQSLMLDIVEVLELPRNVERDVDGPRADVERRGNVALERVATISS